MERIASARDLARRLLAEPLPRRWAHTQGVGEKAESIAHILGRDADLLACAAWLHDIGYAPDLAATGLHSLDGARYLRDNTQADDRLARLVAHHSCARIEARNRGLDQDLYREFPPVGGLLEDALTYADMTTSPDGHPVAAKDRLDEILLRYGSGEVVHQSIAEARSEIEAAALRIGTLLGGGGSK